MLFCLTTFATRTPGTKPGSSSAPLPLRPETETAVAKLATWLQFTVSTPHAHHSSTDIGRSVASGSVQCVAMMHASRCHIDNLRLYSGGFNLVQAVHRVCVWMTFPEVECPATLAGSVRAERPHGSFSMRRTHNVHTYISTYMRVYPATGVFCGSVSSVDPYVELPEWSLLIVAFI